MKTASLDADSVVVEGDDGYDQKSSVSIEEVVRGIAANQAYDVVWHKNGDPIVGLGWSANTELPKEGDSWFWPMEHGEKFSDTMRTRPRYRSPVDALIASLHMNGGRAASIGAMGPRVDGIRNWSGEIEFVDYDGDAVDAEKWWDDGVRSLKPGKATEWGGDDDPMRLDGKQWGQF